MCWPSTIKVLHRFWMANFDPLPLWGVFSTFRSQLYYWVKYNSFHWELVQQSVRKSENWYAEKISLSFPWFKKKIFEIFPKFPWISPSLHVKGHFSRFEMDLKSTLKIAIETLAYNGLSKRTAFNINQDHCNRTGNSIIKVNGGNTRGSFIL